MPTTAIHSRRALGAAAAGLLLTLANAVHAGPVTYATTTSQLCFGAPGCGVASQTIGGAVTVTYTSVSATTVDASPQTFSSLGEIAIGCVGGGTACANQSLAGLNLFINVAQTAPSSGFASFGGGVISGSIRGTASNAVVTWAVPSDRTIGPIRYAIDDTSLALVPPSTNAGRTSIQARIADETVVFRTDTSQLCIGTAGCGVSQQTIGNVTVRFEPVSGARIEAEPRSFTSFGRIVVSCTGGGTACAGTSLAGLNLFLNIAQSAPATNNVSLPGAAFSQPGGGSGVVGGSASTARLQWSGAPSAAIGSLVYVVANAPLSIAPPSTNGGVTSIQGLIVRDPLFANGFE